MGGFLDKLNDVSNLLDDVSDTIDTTNYGIKKMQESGQNINWMIQRAASEENEIDRKKIREYEKRENMSIRRTVIFCVLVILATILICIFL